MTTKTWQAAPAQPSWRSQLLPAAWWLRLFKPIDIAPLVVFRIFFGAVMLWEVWRYFTYNRVVRYYIEPQYVFPYFGFDWVQPLPGAGMIWLFHLLGILSVCIIIGLSYRLVMPLFFVIFTYVYLLDQTQYLNHLYLVGLIAFLMIFLPLNRAVSVDTLIDRDRHQHTAPAWTLWLLLAQIGIVYFFGGVAKLNADWLQGAPMRVWLANRTDFPVIGHLFTEEWMVMGFVYGGLLLDLLIAPFLLWRKTRWLALFFGAVFHLTNYQLFNIGIFPWFMLGANFLFLQPGTWRRLLPARWRGVEAVQAASGPQTMTTRHWLIIAGLGVYLSWQVLFPLRHFLYPGNVSWTEEGHKFAWHMKLRSKSGDVRLFATDKESGTTWEMAPEYYLNDRQYEKMAGTPEMIVAFSHFLRDQITAQGFPDVEVRAWTPTSLNHRERQLLIDPTVDLTQVRSTLLADSWILPLEQPLNGRNHILLIANRGEDNLLLINLTRHDFPLDRLHLQAGDLRLDNSHWGGLSALRDMQCLRALPSAASGASLNMICSEAADPVIAETVFWTGGFDVYFDAEPVAHCASETCIISVPAEAT